MRRLRGLSPRDGGPSWDDAILLGTVFYAAACLLIGVAFTSIGLAVLGVVLNLTYAVMKLRCWINHCCDGRRDRSVALAAIKKTVGLQPLEAGMCLAIGTLTAGLVVYGNYLPAIGLGWFGHGAVRWMDRYFRFCAKSWDSIFDWQSGGIILFGAFAILIDIFLTS